MDQELPDTAADVLGRHFVCTHQTAALLNMKLRHVHHIENVMSNGKPRLLSINAYLHEEYSC